MTDVAKINDELLRYSQKLALAVNEYDKACVDAANARTDYDVMWAQQLLKAEGGTVGERESQTTIVCESVMRSSRIAEAMRDALKERIRSLQAVFKVFRPVADRIGWGCHAATSAAKSSAERNRLTAIS